MTHSVVDRCSSNSADTAIAIPREGGIGSAVARLSASPRIAILRIAAALSVGVPVGLTILNAALHNDLFLRYRVRLWGAPLNIVDALLAVGLLLCVIVPQARRQPLSRSRWLPAIIAAFALAALGGLVAARTSGATRGDMLRTMHHFLLLPAAVLVSYRLASSLRVCRTMLWAHLAGGALAAVLILVSVLKTASEVPDLGFMREIGYGANYAGLAAMLLLFSLVCGVRWVPPSLSIPLAMLCATGQIGTMSRSDWVAVAGGILGLAIVVVISRKPAALLKLLAATAGLALVLAVLGASIARTFDRDLQEAVSNRIESLLPGSMEGAFGSKAWDTRLPAMQEEIRLWRRSPLVGGGFGVHDVVARGVGERSMGFRHNSWSSTLAETGIAGLVAMLLVFAGTAATAWQIFRDPGDATTRLVAAFGFIAMVQLAVHGFVTMSFNAPRGAIVPGIICGLVLSCRSLQLEARESAG